MKFHFARKGVYPKGVDMNNKKGWICWLIKSQSFDMLKSELRQK